MHSLLSPNESVPILHDYMSLVAPTQLYQKRISCYFLSLNGGRNPQRLSFVKISVFLRQSLQRGLECAGYFSCDELELNITNERDEILFSTLY